MNEYLGPIQFDGQHQQLDYGLFATRPLTGSIGATIERLDLAQPISDDLVESIQTALRNHLVLFFRDQRLSPQQLATLGRRFGELHINPFAAGTSEVPEVMTVRSEENNTLRFAEKWHSDISWERCPAMGSMLYAEQVPDIGGDTLFANMYLAYDTLDPGTRELLSNKRAVHTVLINHSGEPQYAAIPSEPVTHPVFRTHPDTGRKALFVNEYFTDAIVGIEDATARELLQKLFAHATRPDFCCRFRWQRGDLAFWDNRCTQHYATNDYAGHSRLMLRVTIIGDEPY